MHNLLTPTTTSFCLMRAPGIASRYERQPDGSATITAFRFEDGGVVDAPYPPEVSTLTFDEILAEVERDEDVFGVQA